MHADKFTPCDGIYMLSHSVGRMPKSMPAAIADGFIGAWQNGSPDPWGQWLGLIDNFRDELAALFNSSARAFCPQPNVSAGLTKLMHALPEPTGRNVILMTENDFPTTGFVMQQLEKRGWQVRFLPGDVDVQDAQSWRDAMTDQVGVVFITHVHFNTSKLIPVAEVVEGARAKGIFSIVDIAQSAGIVPIDFAQWSADAVVGSSIKWLCGGPGAGYLWVNPDAIQQLHPQDVGWFSHANPFEFDIHHFEYADDSNRFWGGTPSVMPCAIAAHSIALMREIGIETLREHNRKLTQQIVEALNPAVLRTPADPQLRGGTLVLKFDDQDAVVARLNEEAVRFDVRPQGLRLSPHIYVSPAEIQRVIAALAG